MRPRGFTLAELLVVIAIIVGLLALLVYSWFDFPFQCPAVLVTWCALWPVVTLWTQLEEQRGG